jgi:predicted metal-dependent peptidase
MITPVYQEVKKIIEARIKSRDIQDVFLAATIISLFDIVLDINTDTACASLSKTGAGRITINPNFWNVLAELEMKDQVMCGDYKFMLLSHEFLHLYLNHIKRFFVGTSGNRVLMNLAMDLSINQILPFIREENTTLPGVNIHRIRVKFSPIDLKPFQNAEYYYRKLLEYKEKYPDKYQEIIIEYMDSQGNGDVEDHSLHADESSEINRDAFEQRVAKIASSLQYNGQSLQLDFTHTSVLPWKKVLNTLCNHAVKLGRKNLYSRPNKRKGYPYPKIISDKQSKAAILLDNSLSMESMLPKLLKEIYQLTKSHNVQLSLYTVNTDLKYIGELSKSNAAQMLPKVTQGGGTNFSETLPEVCSLIGNIPLIFITDTDGEFPEKKPRNHIVLITTGKLSPTLTSKPYKFPIIDASDMI